MFSGCAITRTCADTSPKVDAHPDASPDTQACAGTG
jgi:hypothetical protein